MNRLRVPGLAVAAAAAILSLAYWTREPEGHDHPEACLNAYWAACQAGDVDAYLGCLAAPLRAEMQARFPDAKRFSTFLQAANKEVKSWVQVLSSESVTSNVHHIDVDEVLSRQTRRRRFELKRQRGGWLITAIGDPQTIKGAILHGTHISEDIDDDSE